MLHVSGYVVDLFEMLQHFEGAFDHVIYHITTAAMAHFLVSGNVPQYQSVCTHETEFASNHLIAAAAIVAVEKDDFVGFLVQDLARMAQAQHVLGVLTFALVTHACLTGHEWFKSFGAQRIKYLHGRDIQITCRPAVVRFFGEDGRHIMGDLIVAQCDVTADHAWVTEVAGHTHIFSPGVAPGLTGVSGVKRRKGRPGGRRSCTSGQTIRCRTRSEFFPRSLHDALW
ncbi:hypothetical protein ALQ97_200054 [Pseudomonas savastanoi pv. glycinea]|nr:hypothetical protein ALQ97_200054 [Pseudomonas savastanoi pv. glycinea]